MKPLMKSVLTEALLQAERLIDTGSADFNDKREKILSILYTADTVLIGRCTMQGDKHKVFAALVVLLYKKLPSFGVRRIQHHQPENIWLQQNIHAVFRSCRQSRSVGTANTHTAICYLTGSN